MRPTNILLRGAKGYGWYQKYMKDGSEAFKKTVPPTPFDWKLDSNQKRIHVFFELSAADKSIGRLNFELADDIVPNTVQNFVKLCTGDNIHSRSYKNTKFFQIQKTFIMGGDVELNDGSGSHSAFKERYIEDENYIIPHSHRGLISMASVGIDSSGSQFYISLTSNPHMNGRCVVFGRLVNSDSTLEALEKVFTFRGVPASDIVISDCGII